MATFAAGSHLLRVGWALASLLLGACQGAMGSAPGDDDAPSARAPDLTAAAARPREELPCFADDGTPAGADITVALEASRVAGVAPLAVFFDASGTRATSTARPFHELAYCWDFGDAHAGAFATNGLSRNQAKGPVAAHVFERPGVYPVRVGVRDAQGRTATATVEISVSDPDAEFLGEHTLCFSARGDFAGCPEGAGHVTSASVGSLAAAVRGGRRLLLRRGETFAGAGIRIDAPGPGMVGAFGDPAAPPPKITYDRGLFAVSSRAPRFSDWRIVDIDFDGLGSPESQLVSVEGRADHLLLLRVRAAHIGAGLMAPNSVIDYWIAHGRPGHDVIDVFVVQDSELTEVVGGRGHNLAYVAAHRLAILGSRFIDSTRGEHVLRTPWIDRGVIASNDLGHAPSPRAVMKIHGPGFDEPGIGRGRYTERVVISDNLVRGTGGTDWLVSIGPQNATSDERVRDVLVERNLFLRGESARVALNIWAWDVTVRSNLFDRGRQEVCVSVGRRGIEPAHEGIQLVHNTCTSDVGARLVSVGEGVSRVTAYNNLISSRGRSAVGDGLEHESGNLVTRSPGLRRVPPSTWEDFALTARSPALDAASGGPWAPWDAFGRPRPASPGGATRGRADVGAVERAP